MIQQRVLERAPCVADTSSKSNFTKELQSLRKDLEESQEVSIGSKSINNFLISYIVEA